MGKKSKLQLRQGGQITTTFIVNFRDWRGAIETVEHLFETQVESSLVEFAIEILGRASLEEARIENKLEVLRIAQNVSKSELGSYSSVHHQLTSFATDLLMVTKPSVKSLDSHLLSAFHSFFEKLEPDIQLKTYSFLGKMINPALLKQSTSFPSMDNLDLRTLLDAGMSTKRFYEQTDIRIKEFVEEATKKNNVTNEKNRADVTKSKYEYQCYNIIENLLAARNQRCVTPPGISQLLLVYIFGGRSRLVCDIFAKQGAKGCYNTVTQKILPKSETTSQRICKDGIECWYSFDNIQKMFKIHRLYGDNQNKVIARVLTSVVRYYPDGLMLNDIQYRIDNNPMKWLYSFEINGETTILGDKLNKDVLLSMVTPTEQDLDIVLGRWDFDIDEAIKKVKDELQNGGTDIIDKMIQNNEYERTYYCSNCEVLQEISGNRKYCKQCKTLLVKLDAVEEEHEVENVEETEDFSSVYKLRIFNNDDVCEPKLVQFKQISDKRVIYPKVRNIQQANDGIYETEKCVYVNPNKFERVEKVFEEIQKRTKTFDNPTSFLLFDKAGKVSVETQELSDVRQYLIITVDGLPHRIGIEVIKHCFKCNVCEKKISSISDVSKHFEKFGHEKYIKRFSNIIIKLGGLHLELNMLRSFVSLNWKIDYSYIVNSIGFKSPKAQIFQQKVQDLHKSFDTFNATRKAKCLEYVRPFVIYCLDNNVDPNSRTFDDWLTTEVQDETYKANLEIDKYFGTSIWLVRAGHRANYLKLYRAGMRIFSGLFHINGNLNYSVIELFEDYMMSIMEMNNKELYDHLSTRLCSNINKVPLNSQPQDARHEEMNKAAQNMFPGKSLEELDLACCIVDDVSLLRKQSFSDMGITERDTPRIVIPDYSILITKIRYAIRKNEYFSSPHLKKAAYSIDGNELNESLSNIFEISHQRRKDDILKVVRFNDFSEGYSSRKGKFPLMKDENFNKQDENEINTQLQVLIECIDDSELKEQCKTHYSFLKKGQIEKKEAFLSGLLEKNYEF